MGLETPTGKVVTPEAPKASPQPLTPTLKPIGETPKNPNIDVNINGGSSTEISPEAGTKAALGGIVQELTPGLVDAPPPAGKLHGSTLKRIESIDKKIATEDPKTIGSLSIKEIRSGKMLLEESKKDKEQALAIKNETARLIDVYTSSCDHEWYTLDYSRLDGLSTETDNQGLTHEMDIGLGEILRDPDITDILIEKNGQIVKAHKGLHDGRLSFLDENNNYAATRTGDRFRILTDKDTDVTKPADEYLEKYLKDSETRNKHAETLAQAPVQSPMEVDEGGGPAPTNLTYESTPGNRRVKLGTTKIPYRFFSTTVKNPKTSKSVHVTNGGAPGRSTPSKRGRSQREAFKDSWAKSQIRNLYEKGIRVIVSLAQRPDMIRVVDELKKEGLDLTLITQGYLCSPPGKRNIELFK
ncbi:hypothetical protein HON58_03255, partial [Candidatus Peregrinibacteria bacterium]|nr:hypothetical protein [Candidatus Peregrinibacteria bacterium]